MSSRQLNEPMVSVMLVDDHDIFRKGLHTILSRVKHIRILAEAENGRSFLESMKSQRPDVVLMDVRMPIMDGIEATRSALRIDPSVRIIALSMFGEEEYLHSMLDAGASGFLLKNIKKAELVLAIDRVANGQSYYSPELLPFFTRKFVSPTQEQEQYFTPREVEVLQLIAKGMTSQEIGDALFISKRTVEGHKANLIAKTGSKNVLDLLIYSVKHDLVQI